MVLNLGCRVPYGYGLELEPWHQVRVLVHYIRMYGVGTLLERLDTRDNRPAC